MKVYGLNNGDPYEVLIIEGLFEVLKKVENCFETRLTEEILPASHPIGHPWIQGSQGGEKTWKILFHLVSRLNTIHFLILHNIKDL